MAYVIIALSLAVFVLLCLLIGVVYENDKLVKENDRISDKFYKLDKKIFCAQCDMSTINGQVKDLMKTIEKSRKDLES